MIKVSNFMQYSRENMKLTMSLRVASKIEYFILKEII